MLRPVSKENIDGSAARSWLIGLCRPLAEVVEVAELWGGGGPLWLVREVAAIWGGPLWVVRGQIYGFTNTCVCINYNSSLTDLLRDHDVQLA